MMRNNLKELLNEIQELEAVVSDKIQQKGHDLQFTMHEGKAVFESAIRRQHQVLAKSLHRYLLESSLIKIITAPAIYFVVFPLLLLDAAIWVFQTVCFPIYQIPKVRRRDYIALECGGCICRHRFPHSAAVRCNSFKSSSATQPTTTFHGRATRSTERDIQRTTEHTSGPTRTRLYKTTFARPPLSLHALHRTRRND